MQLFTLVIWMAFQAVKDKMQDKLPPDLFQGDMSHIPRRSNTGLSVKQAGISLSDPTQTAEANYKRTTRDRARSEERSLVRVN